MTATENERYGKMADVTMVEVMKFFGMKIADFRKQWGELTDKDKTDLRTGIGNGTLTYL